MAAEQNVIVKEMSLDAEVRSLAEQVRRLCEAVFVVAHLAIDPRFVGEGKADIQKTISDIRNETSIIGGHLSIMESKQEKADSEGD